MFADYTTFFSVSKSVCGLCIFTAGKKINNKKICLEILHFNIGENIILADVIFHNIKRNKSAFYQ
jgi:hypothetical protein